MATTTFRLVKVFDDGGASYRSNTSSKLNYLGPRHFTGAPCDVITMTGDTLRADSTDDSAARIATATAAADKAEADASARIAAAEAAATEAEAVWTARVASNVPRVVLAR